VCFVDALIQIIVSNEKEEDEFHFAEEHGIDRRGFLQTFEPQVGTGDAAADAHHHEGDYRTAVTPLQ
jgi:hypothetical protein